MLKYLNAEQTFAEIPDEITLCINITECPIHCKGCHSPFLWEDIGSSLTVEVLDELISKNKGISCVCFMGGVQSPEEINKLASHIRSKSILKTAWYSGETEIPSTINLYNFDYIKIGPYIEEKGGLANPNTNQQLFKICGFDDHTNTWRMFDITSKFWKK